jgi:transposase-like protein
MSSRWKVNREIYDQIVRAHVEGGLTKHEISKQFGLSRTTVDKLWQRGLPHLDLPPIKERVEAIFQKRLQEEEDRLAKALAVAKEGVIAWTAAVSQRAGSVAKEIQKRPAVLPPHIVGAELDRSIRLVKFLQGEAEQKVEVDMGIPPPEQLAKIIKCLPEAYKETLMKALKVAPVSVKAQDEDGDGDKS